MRIMQRNFSGGKQWKFALLSLGRPEYLLESYVVSSCFQGCIWCLGTISWVVDTTPNRAFTTSNGKLSEKSDLFSCGDVLLHLVTEHKPVDGSHPLGDESLVEWYQVTAKFSKLALEPYDIRLNVSNSFFPH